ncbi:DUF4230 domain-containing protein [Treponema pectinovorum]|uniref:DUF4230 domain-containing protein n=1 Tax=Treponema pectinovorum TaxID=164 RepID=UPI0011CCD409|nr:DUF4230 domain-containing protein [Treponema pectinovorum]
MKVLTKKILQSLVFKIVFFAFVLCALGSGSYILKKKLTAISIHSNRSLISGELKNCQELSTLKYGYSEIVSIKKTRIAGLAKSFSIVRYSAVIRVGIIDFGKATIEVSATKKKVYVKLPVCEILSNEITDMEVFDEARSVFVPIATQEIFDLIKESQAEKQQSLIEAGIIKEAQERSVNLTKSILSALGFSDIRVE